LLFVSASLLYEIFCFADALFFLFYAGSFSVSVLSGKVMFRDVYFITKNYSMRIQLGLAIFRWWRPLTRKKVNEG